MHGAGAAVEPLIIFIVTQRCKDDTHRHPWLGAGEVDKAQRSTSASGSAACLGNASR
jgi:hypothetical protein